MDRSSSKKSSKGTLVLNGTLKKITLIDTIDHSIPQTAVYMYFSKACRTFSKIDHTLSHKTHLSKFKIEFISSISSVHNSIKQEINYKKTGKTQTGGKYSKQSATKQPMGQLLKKKIKRYPKTNENRNIAL